MCSEPVLPVATLRAHVFSGLLLGDEPLHLLEESIVDGRIGAELLDELLALELVRVLGLEDPVAVVVRVALRGAVWVRGIRPPHGPCATWVCILIRAATTEAACDHVPAGSAADRAAGWPQTHLIQGRHSRLALASPSRRRRICACHLWQGSELPGLHPEPVQGCMRCTRCVLHGCPRATGNKH